MPVVNAEVDVLIVGGGPVGLTARVLLERWGVRASLVEKHGRISPFPRSRLVNVRTMEIFRQLGLAEKITARAFTHDFGRVRFRDTLFDHDFASAAMIGVHAPMPESPALGVVSSQDRLEPTLVAAADAPMHLGVELVDLVEDTDGVEAVLVDRAGVKTRVRARYVLGADGAHSTVRSRLGIGTTGPGALGHTTTVVFDADLTRWNADQPAGVYFTSHGSFLPLYPEGGWAWLAPTPDDAATADWRELVTRALGADVRVDVARVEHWVVNAFVAERFRQGRVLLAGDAAHAIPPAGGLGMNAGIADAHNLCWKLAGVVHGWAAPSLLSTYETERRPVAHETLRQAVANAQLMRQVQQARHEQLRSGDTSAPAGLPWSERYFAQLGFVLGVPYDATDLSDIGTDYVPTTRPGHRMPHRWLSAKRSTLDAVGEWFTLLTPDPAHWRQHTTVPCPVRVETLPAEHADLCGPRGALLVRPDGYVAGRWCDRPTDDSALPQALATITGSTTPDVAGSTSAGRAGRR